jgi:tellurite resistance protein TerA
MELSQGANAPLSGAQATVRLSWTAAAGVEADASAYLLTAGGKVRGDQDMIFYNQPSGEGDAIRFSAGDRSFAVALDRLPDAIEKIVFCATIDEAVARRQTMAMLKDAAISVTGAGDLSFTPALAGATEAAMVFGELYRRAGQWKFRAVGQGFNGGLAPLARSFGIDVADTPPASPATVVEPPAPPPRPVSLSKVTLEKSSPTISLEKRGTSFGEIGINLNWSRARGWLSGSAVDLDLGCLFEMADGRKGVVQALGRVFGDLNQPPYIALSGDDRTGDVSEGETLRINGSRWSEIARVCVFANIYDGVPNWQKTDGVVLVSMPDQPPIEVRLDEGRNDKRLCGIVMLENDGGALKATRLVNYVRDQQELDRAYSFGLRWVAGRKD